MGRKQQRKGAEGERELVDVLRRNGYQVERGGSQTYGTIPDVVGLPGIHIECKRQERLDLLGAIEQAETDAARFMDGRPAVFHRRNRSPWLVTMPLNEWLALYKQAERNESV